MDALKQYLQEHRQALDVETPPANPWAGVPKKPTYLKYMISAITAAIIGIGSWLLFHQEPEKLPPVLPDPPAEQVIIQDTVPDPPKDSTGLLRKTPRKKALPATRKAEPRTHKKTVRATAPVTDTSGIKKQAVPAREREPRATRKSLRVSEPRTDTLRVKEVAPARSERPRKKKTAAVPPIL